MLFSCRLARALEHRAPPGLGRSESSRLGSGETGEWILYPAEHIGVNGSGDVLTEPLFGEHAFASEDPLRPSFALLVPVQIDGALDHDHCFCACGPRNPNALEEVGRAADIEFVYSPNVIHSAKRMSLRAENMTVAAVLTDLLVDAQVDVLLSGGKYLTLTPREPSAAVTMAGTIVGTVTEAGTSNPVVNAQIAVDGAGRAFTDAEGQYRITNVPPGRHSVSVTSIGYRRLTQEVEVVDGATVTVDFVLELSPTTLNELVVTATGEQRRVELGHVVGRINADSVVREAPISTISELLTGRVAGVQVLQDQGTVGGKVTLQVRGPNSAYLGNEPIVIVDGMRYTSSVLPTLRVSGTYSPGDSEPTSPLNDLNPNEIESIEVVKGPSAATLYGTDAANGVIVVTTKRGRAGPARWNAYFRGGFSDIPTYDYPDRYWAWRSSDGVPSLTSVCPLEFLARSSCVQESVTVMPELLNDPALTIFGRQPRGEAGLSVAGGNQELRYYVSAGYEDAAGPLVMPRALVEILEEQRGGPLPDEWLNPNTRNNLNLRVSATAQFTPKAELNVQAGYIRSATRSLATFNPFSLGYRGGNQENPYGRYEPPEQVFAGQSTESTDRFIGRAEGRLRPASWLQLRAALGLDFGSRNRFSLVRRGDAPGDNPTGAVQDDRARQLATTGEFGATATARRGRLSARTSLGVQYVRNLTDLLANGGTDLPVGGESVPVAGTRNSLQSYAETVTLGGYLEQTLGLDERLFLTGALRIDGASTFGRNYDAAVYPKLSASWLLSEAAFFPCVPGLDEFRLRYAYGASGQQPLSEWARPQYAVFQAGGDPYQGLIDGAAATVIRLTGVGNPDLRPERVREHEFGFDASGLRRRVQLGLTWYRRRTVDQILFRSLPLGYGSTFTNLGLTTQRGFEAEVRAQIVNTRLVSWDVTAMHSSHRTMLVDAGGLAPIRSAQSSYVEGYPLGARFLREFTYEDANGDGLIAWGEVSGTGEWVYAGEGAPPISQTLTSVLGLFDSQVRVSAMLERRGGHTQVNAVKTGLCTGLKCLAAVDPSTPLAEQAEVAAIWFHGWAYLEPGDFTRLREVTVAMDIPAAFLRAVRARSASVSLSARNLALWTNFTGGDPDVFTGHVVGGGIPQARTWTLRFDIGY